MFLDETSGGPCGTDADTNIQNMISVFSLCGMRRQVIDQSCPVWGG